MQVEIALKYTSRLGLGPSLSTFPVIFRLGGRYQSLHRGLEVVRQPAGPPQDPRARQGVDEEEYGHLAPDHLGAEISRTELVVEPVVGPGGAPDDEAPRKW